MCFFSGHAHAQDQLGTVTNSVKIACPIAPLSAAKCYQIEVACPDVQNYAVYMRVLAPAAPVAAAILGTGGTGIGLFEFLKYGKTTVRMLYQANFTVAEVSFGSPFISSTIPQGWEYFANGTGVRKAACRYATTVNWIKENFAPAIPLAIAGVSAGAAEIGYGMAYYNLDAVIDFALLLSGPPFSRLDWACDQTQAAAVEWCSGAKVGMQIPLLGAEQFIDPAYQPTYANACSYEWNSHSTVFDAMLRSDSITTPEAAFSYTHPVEFIYGGLDVSSAIRQGEYYRAQITSPTQARCVPDATHSIANALDAAELVATELIANTH